MGEYNFEKLLYCVVVIGVGCTCLYRSEKRVCFNAEWTSLSGDILTSKIQ
jgi:hypothetical protein